MAGSDPIMASWGVGAAVATLLAGHGLRKGSLGWGGAAAAWCVGAASLGASPRAGVAMLAFYATGSALTKVGADRKRLLDAEYDASAERGAGQVLACSALATGLAVGHAVLLGSASDGPVFAHGAGGGGATHSALMMGVAAHYAVCAGDTWASEVGSLARERPWLVTSLRRVPPGTNGAVSWRGLAASAAGGAFIGVVMWASGAALGASALTGPDWRLVPACAGFGLAGSLLDSVLGATLQETLYDTAQRKVVASSARGAAGVESVCGLDVLSNMQVNLVSVGVMTLLGCWVGAVAQR